jgi:hypothetical protein
VSMADASKLPSEVVSASTVSGTGWPRSLGLARGFNGRRRLRPDKEAL